MPIFSCFAPSFRKKKKDLARKKKEDLKNEDDRTMKVRLHQQKKVVDAEEGNSTSFSVAVPFSVPKISNYHVKVISHESPPRARPVIQDNEAEEVAYEGEDEHEQEQEKEKQSVSVRRQFSHSNLDIPPWEGQITGQEHDDHLSSADHGDSSPAIEIKNDGHLSDPGVGKVNFLASPKLKRSCSNLEAGRVLSKRIAAPMKCESFEELQKLEELGNTSPVSVASRCSADKVMLRKHSSTQVLPSKSRRLWWKLFLWSHRNLHEPWVVKKGLSSRPANVNQQGGYSSDTLEPNRGMDKSESQSPISFIGECSTRETADNWNQRWNGFQGGSGLWPQNQWIAFAAESSSSTPLTRVDEWVQEIPTESILDIENEERNEVTFPPSPGNSRLPPRSHLGRNMNLPEEIAYANSVIQSLNSSSTVAHISGMGLKVIPAISGFSSLRTVNLSGNSIVQIIPGSLPKGLHCLNLSRNKITAIEGLRELTRLRILDLSYNKISRIGQGLSNCMLIKELYLAGNKISIVEGIHRLLKLLILDLSFNKITTLKALGQLVANYNSLQALNLLGNPIQSHISDDQLRKALCGLIPKLAYLNKQPVNQQKAREVATEAISKVALGNSSLSGRRRSSKRVGHGGSSSSSTRHARSSASFTQKTSRHGAKTRSHHRSAKSSAQA